MTKLQWTAVIAAAGYGLWEFVILADWKADTAGPLIRVDLIFIYPVLAVLAAAALLQYFRK